MSRIAVKIFLTFWLTFFVVVVGFSVMLQVLGGQEPSQPLGEFHRRQLEQHQTQIQTIARNRGLQGLRRFAQDVEANRGITVFLLAEDGADILKRDVPVAVSSFVASNRDTGVPLMQMRERRMLLGPVTIQGVEPPARLVLWLPMAASDTSPLERWWGGRYAAAQLGVGLLVSGLMSLALSLTLTRPLNRLEQAASRLAQSHFDTRDIDAVAWRRDEIGSLAKEFAHMARQLHGALESRQRLLRDVSHELRSPLTRLQVAIGLASRQVGPDHVAAFERMELECERLNALIGEVLALARAGNDSQEHTRIEFDLAATLRSLVADARFEAQSAGKDVTLQVPERLTLSGNESRVGSAIENVVRNAIAYTPVQTAVSVVASRKADGVCVVVTDAGPGVPDVELTNIFLPFYRVSQARERETGGTGVGLAIAAQAVQWHGGRIEARNRPEGGLAIEMRFPGVG
ncbi:MAG: hypothetical protein QG643_1413 [Pseudomonadota bacterium]|nr:hypothetical protein [Pseudomonadota bacterium]